MNNVLSLVKMHQRLSSKILIISALCSSVILASCMRASAQDDGTRWALVNVSDCFMRAEPRYGSECVSQSRMGTLVQVLETKGYWVKVRTPEPYEGWVNELALSPTQPLSAGEQAKMGEYGPKLQPFTEKEARKWLSKDRFICLKDDTFVYEEASSQSARICNLKMSCIVGAGKASCGSGWISVALPDGRQGFVPASDVQPFRTWAEDVCWHRLASGEDVSGDIVSLAKQFLGMPYMWAGMSVGHFDCSGLTGFCYFMNGILLPRDASQQVKCGIEVPFEDMKAGDLVFFGNTSVGHVALCIGNHKIIHASQIVRINSLVPGEKDYYGRNILHIRRILGHETEGELKAVPIRDSPSYF